MRPSSDTLLVWTGAPCAYGCGACPIDPAVAPDGLLLADLPRSVADLPNREGRLGILVGGEPFLRPDFLRLIAILRAAGLVPGVVTTGRPLVYPQVRENLRRVGLAYLRVQLFGFGNTHNHYTAVEGAFDQAITGVRAWATETGSACSVDVALSLRRRPTDRLVSEVEGIGRQIALPDVQIVIGSHEVDPEQRESLELARSALAGWNDDPMRPILAWEELTESPSPASHLTISPLRTRFVGTAPPTCCLGTVGEQPALAVEGTQANSFNFVRTETSVPWATDAADCEAYRGTGHGVRGTGEAELHRGLWLADDDRLVFYATDTGDFSAGEIMHIKDEMSHLFIDRSPAGVLDDFVEGMRRVLPDPTCGACDNRTHCSRRFQMIEGPPFAREEAWISDYIVQLRGHVLDVGCGEQLYRDELAPLVNSGTVRYTGLDPDETSLGPLKEALPHGRFYVGGIEHFRDKPQSYDRILCLRSLNHVFDIDEALARMSRLLKPGGQLLIVETTPFAMLRRPEQVAAADRAPRAGHQHFRNVTSEDVLPFARRRSLRIVEHHPASLQTSNEWILLLERAAG